MDLPPTVSEIGARWRQRRAALEAARLDVQSWSELRDGARRGAFRGGARRDDVEDIAQTVLSEMHRWREGGRTFDHPRAVAWIAGYRRALDLNDRNVRRRLAEQTFGRRGLAPGPFDDQVNAQSYVRVIMEIAHDTLTPKQFDRFERVRRLGVAGAVDELAKETGRNPEAVRTDIRRAVAKVHKQVAEMNPNTETTNDW